MSAELTIRGNGFVEFAFAGERSAIWHRQGNQVDKELHDLEYWTTWERDSGMDWSILQVALQTEYGIIADRSALLRSDTKAPLAIVSDRYHVVQPAQVFDFFRAVADNHGCTLSTAGTLFGGKRFFALAEFKSSAGFVHDNRDELRTYLLMVTSCDGSLPTIADFVNVRVVCNNTLRMSLGEKATSFRRTVSHKRAFDPTAIAYDMGLVAETSAMRLERMRELSKIAVDIAEARSWFENQFFTDARNAKGEQAIGERKTVDDLLAKFSNGIGAVDHAGTAYGLVNAITEQFTHGRTGSRASDSQKFIDGTVGKWDERKSELVQLIEREYLTA